MTEPRPNYGPHCIDFALQPGLPDREPDELPPGPRRCATLWDGFRFVEADPATGEVLDEGEAEVPTAWREATAI